MQLKRGLDKNANIYRSFFIKINSLSFFNLDFRAIPFMGEQDGSTKASVCSRWRANIV